MAKTQLPENYIDLIFDLLGLPFRNFDERAAQTKLWGINPNSMTVSLTHSGMGEATALSLGQAYLDANPAYQDGHKTIHFYGGKPISHVFQFYRQNNSNRTRFSAYPD